MPVNRRILVVVDLAAGHPPERGALEKLTKVAAHYGERPAQWVVGGVPGAPPLHFENGRLVVSAPLEPDTSYVVVRYIGDTMGRWGLSYPERVAGRTIYIILINQEKHRRFRHFLPERHLEAQTLVHEYGHLIGLPPFDHGYYARYPNFSDGAHCINPDCALSLPRLRALLYGLGHVVFAHHYLEDYCAACRAAIAAAKRHWRDTATACAGCGGLASSCSSSSSRSSGSAGI
jgi:hypothetical protein